MNKLLLKCHQPQIICFDMNVVGNPLAVHVSFDKLKCQFASM